MLIDDARAHGAPLERGITLIWSYKHGAPPEHCVHSRQGTNHFSAKPSLSSKLSIYSYLSAISGSTFAARRAGM